MFTEPTPKTHLNPQREPESPYLDSNKRTVPSSHQGRYHCSNSKHPQHQAQTAKAPVDFSHPCLRGRFYPRQAEPGL